VARQFQLEGLIAKRPDSVYDTGRRSGARVKVKLTRAQEFVVGGYTPPEHGRKYFGTGFSDKAWQHCTPAYRRSGVPPRGTSCPFVNLLERRPGRWGLEITPAVMKRCV
jgi:bifunctional non-homologous end joining protein LigD